MGVHYLLLLTIVPLISADFTNPPPSTVHLQKHGNDEYDCLIFVNDNYNVSTSKEENLMANISKALEEIGKKLSNIDAKAGIYVSSNLPGKAFIYSPTGPLNTDISDSRSIYDAGMRGAELAAKSGKKKLLLVVGPMTTAPSDASWSAPHLKALNAVLGVFYGLYVPLQYREAHKDRAEKYTNLFLHAENGTYLDWVVKHALAIEKGRVIARDLCGADPERITPTEFVNYTNHVLTNYTGKISVALEEISNESYPMITMVQRASMEIPRFQGHVMKLDYNGTGTVNTSLYFLGLGNTYDTGGADLKIDGTMVGMSRQKCGAAAVVGLMITASELNATANIHGRLAVVRNNIGTRSFVVDTIVKVKSGKRIRIGNTAADGRMILADLLYHAKEEGIMDNGPAAKAGTAEELQKAGDKVADIGEISVVRKEDYDFNLNTRETEDLLQSNNANDDGTNRGHQIPMAFMVQASGLSENGLNAKPEEQLKYTHLDVSGSAGVIDIVPTASPLTMLTMKYFAQAEPTSNKQ
ncbi:hypothetical protein AAHC03_025687 [Spirometra sp. Aus1]